MASEGESSRYGDRTSGHVRGNRNMQKLSPSPTQILPFCLISHHPAWVATQVAFGGVESVQCGGKSVGPRTLRRTLQMSA